jgi:RNA polymerase sigma-70 factor (ECF subfamily)
MKDQFPKDNDGFAVLVMEHQNIVVNTCHGFLHNREDAEDAAQQVFMKAWQTKSSFQSKSKISTWLYRIAVNTSLDLLRKRRRSEQWHALLSIFGMTSELPTITKDPLVEVEKREDALLLMKAIDSLPDNQRSAWVLTTTGGFSSQDAAEIMNTSVSAVESLKHRARGRLRKFLMDVIC